MHGNDPGESIGLSSVRQAPCGKSPEPELWKIAACDLALVKIVPILFLCHNLSGLQS